MSINDAYHTASTLAYTMGCDNFDSVMPPVAGKNFLRGYMEAYGFEKFNMHAARALVVAACRTERW